MPKSSSRPSVAPAVSSASVQAVGVSFAVLEELAQSEDPVGTTELARRLGETKARVHRHLFTLRELGYVEQDALSLGYQLSWRAYRLGTSVAENFGIRRIAHRHLLRLHQDSAQTVMLAIPAGLDVTVIDAIQSTGHVAITVRPGSVIPASSSALGRVILAFQPLAASAQVAERLPEDLQNSQSIEQVLDNVRQRWFEVASNERLPGIAALAAPIFDARNRVVASVGVIGSHAVITRSPPQALIAQVQDAAAHISAELRSTAWQDFDRTPPGRKKRS